MSNSRLTRGLLNLVAVTVLAAGANACARGAGGGGKQEAKETIKVKGQEPLNPPLPLVGAPRGQSAERHDLPPAIKRREEIRLEQLRIGAIAFNPPSEMREAVRERISARVSLPEELQGVTVETLTEGLQGRGDARVEPLAVGGDNMKVTLTGSSFAIEALDPEPQDLRPGMYREWKWDVTPRKAGRQSLVMTAFVVFEGENLEFKSLEQPIDVRVSRQGVGDWLGRNWQALMSASGVTGVTLVGALYRRRRLAGGEARHARGVAPVDAPVERTAVHEGEAVAFADASHADSL